MVSFPSASIKVESDLLGAAHAVCGYEAGIACILGTGANSCQYDGENIVANVPPLGYVLGDEVVEQYLASCYSMVFLRVIYLQRYAIYI